MKKLLIVLSLLPFIFIKSTPQINATSTIFYTSDWTVLNIIGTVYAMTTYIEPTDFQSTEFQIENLGYNFQTVSTYDSYLKLYDGAVLVFEKDMDELIGTDMEGNIVIDFVNWIITSDEGDFLIDNNGGTYEIDGVSIAVMQTFTSVPTGYEALWESVNYIKITRDYFLIKYYYLNSGVVSLYQTQNVYTPFPEAITDPPDLSTTNIFEYWAYRTTSGDWIKYDYSLPLTTDMYYGENEYVFMMAVYTNYVNDYTTTTSETLNAPSNLLSILGVVGMNNTVGFVFLYTLINIIIVFIIANFQQPPVYGAVVSMIVSGLFVFFNMLPVYIVVIVILLYALFFLTGKRGGVAT